jgi:hypothetical protein
VDLQNRILELHPTAPVVVLVAIWSPCCLPVGQDRQADHRRLVAIDQPRVVDEHPAGEIALLSTLHIHMDEQQLFLAVATPDARQQVHRAPSLAPLPRDRLQFFVKERHRALPVDRGVQFGVDQREEMG